MSVLRGSDTLKQAYPKINSKFDALDAKDRELQSNIDTSNRNNTAEIERIDNRIDNIVSQAGDDNTEIVDARLGADGKARPTLGTLVREIHEEVVEPKYTDPIVIEGGIGSIPDNVVEGQVSSVRIQGLTATNLVKNGDFSNGTTGWRAENGNITANNNIATHTINNSFRGDIKESGKHKAVIGNKLFVRAKVRVTNSQCQAIRLIIEYLKNNVWVSQDAAGLSNPVENQWYNFFAVLELRDGFDYEDYRLAIRHLYEDENTALGKQMEVKEVIMIDLTAHGLDHLTAEEVNTMLPNWFDGTKSTIGAFRIRSVSEDETQESSAYVIATDSATGEIIELRSLPNGTKDEIDVTAGKLIKRVSDWITLDGSEGVVKDDSEGWRQYSTKTDGLMRYTFLGMKNIVKSTSNQYKGNIYSLNLPSVSADDTYLNKRGIAIDTNGRLCIYTTGELIQDFINWLSENPITLIYQLAQEKIIELQPQSLTIYPNGTVYWEPIVKETAVYNNGISIDNGIPIKAIKKLYMTDGQTKTEIPIQNINIAPDGLSFTIVGATDGETYEYIYEYDSSLTTIPTMEIIANKNLKAIVRSTDKALTTLNSAVLDLNDFTVAMLLNHEMRLTLLEV